MPRASSPTVDEIARAIVAACRETRADPTRIADKIPSTPNNVAERAIRNARVYAALALREAFPTYPSVSIARAVGAGSPDNYLGVVIAWQRKGALRWFDPEALARVVAATLDPLPHVETESECDGAVTQGLEPAFASGTIEAAPGRVYFIERCPECGSTASDANISHGLNCSRHPANAEAVPDAPEEPEEQALDLPPLPNDLGPIAPSYERRNAYIGSYDGNRRRSAEEILRAAVLNTGGRPVDRD